MTFGFLCFTSQLRGTEVLQSVADEASNANHGSHLAVAVVIAMGGRTTKGKLIRSMSEFSQAWWVQGGPPSPVRLTPIITYNYCYNPEKNPLVRHRGGGENPTFPPLKSKIDTQNSHIWKYICFSNHRRTIMGHFVIASFPNISQTIISSIYVKFLGCNSGPTLPQNILLMEEILNNHLGI